MSVDQTLTYLGGLGGPTSHVSGVFRWCAGVPFVWDSEEWETMKNTGKRIFFAVVVVALVNVPTLVMAGVFSSSR